MNEYQKGKERAREKARQYQELFTMGIQLSWREIWEIQNRLERLAKRYGLLKEFKENGII